jgi:hypothetical protein
MGRTFAQTTNKKNVMGILFFFSSRTPGPTPTPTPTEPPHTP